MNSLRCFALSMLYNRLSYSDDEFYKWLQHLDLLYSIRTWECGKKMKEEIKFQIGIQKKMMMKQCVI